jgi:DNA-binding CsgD family transcriptional regulator
MHVEMNLLSQRELEVLKLMCNGYSYQEIAELLCLSVRTIQNHKANIAEKIEVKSQSGLIIYALLNSIVELDDIRRTKSA